ncbi:MAG: hypothetical protein EOP06_01585, partial [Proteobacteria bacterium]
MMIIAELLKMMVTGGQQSGSVVGSVIWIIITCLIFLTGLKALKAFDGGMRGMIRVIMFVVFSVIMLNWLQLTTWILNWELFQNVISVKSLKVGGFGDIYDVAAEEAKSMFGGLLSVNGIFHVVKQVVANTVVMPVIIVVSSIVSAVAIVGVAWRFLKPMLSSNGVTQDSLWEMMYTALKVIATVAAINVLNPAIFKGTSPSKSSPLENSWLTIKEQSAKMLKGMSPGGTASGKVEEQDTNNLYRLATVAGNAIQSSFVMFTTQVYTAKKDIAGTPSSLPIDLDSSCEVSFSKAISEANKNLDVAITNTDIIFKSPAANSAEYPNIGVVSCFRAMMMLTIRGFQASTIKEERTNYLYLMESLIRRYNDVGLLQMTPSELKRIIQTFDNTQVGADPSKGSPSAAASPEKYRGVDKLNLKILKLAYDRTDQFILYVVANVGSLGQALEVADNKAAAAAVADSDNDLLGRMASNLTMMGMSFYDTGAALGFYWDMLRYVIWLIFTVFIIIVTTIPPLLATFYLKFIVEIWVDMILLKIIAYVALPLCLINERHVKACWNEFVKHILPSALYLPVYGLLMAIPMAIMLWSLQTAMDIPLKIPYMDGTLGAMLSGYLFIQGCIAVWPYYVKFCIFLVDLAQRISRAIPTVINETVTAFFQELQKGLQKAVGTAVDAVGVLGKSAMSNTGRAAVMGAGLTAAKVALGGAAAAAAAAALPALGAVGGLSSMASGVLSMGARKAVNAGLNKLSGNSKPSARSMMPSMSTIAERGAGALESLASLMNPMPRIMQMGNAAKVESPRENNSWAANESVSSGAQSQPRLAEIDESGSQAATGQSRSFTERSAPANGGGGNSSQDMASLHRIGSEAERQFENMGGEKGHGELKKDILSKREALKSGSLKGKERVEIEKSLRDLESKDKQMAGLKGTAEQSKNAGQDFGMFMSSMLGPIIEGAVSSALAKTGLSTSVSVNNGAAPAIPMNPGLKPQESEQKRGKVGKDDNVIAVNFGGGGGGGGGGGSGSGTGGGN